MLEPRDAGHRPIPAFPQALNYRTAVATMNVPVGLLQTSRQSMPVPLSGKMLGGLPVATSSW
jgi:hypothetical protein